MPESLEGDCCEEELSEAQKIFYSNALKEYEKSMTEINQLQKDALSVTKNGNIWTVKSLYHVKVHRSPAPNSAPSTQMPPQTPIVSTPKTSSTQMGSQTQVVSALKVMSSQPSPQAQILSAPRISSSQVVVSKGSIPPIASVPNLQLPINPPSKQPVVVRPALPPILPPVPIIDQTVFQASQLLSKFTETTAKNQKTPPAALPTTPMIGHQVPVAQIVLTSQPAQAIKKPVNTNPVQVFCQIKPPDVGSSLSLPKSNQPQKATGPPPNMAKKLPTTPSDETRALLKIPSLSVVVKPVNALPDKENQKKRESLDAFVKSRLVLDARRFAEWLMQVGLLRSQQFGLCRTHITTLPQPLQLRMYAEESRFPHSGGYVWITKCCDRNFVSIFRESIFEDSSHPPSVLLKLIYHWACQTPITNVIQWVKIDHHFLRSFYSTLRSVCTVEVHSNTPLFGLALKNARVEVGVISLGTTSADGKRRDVKVEILGILDQETGKIRLRASEPITGDTRDRARFTKIMEPLPRWVDKKATILTDFTIDRSVLEELGFHQVVQKNLNQATQFDRLTNRGIMDYLRRTVPKVFQNTLSLLSTSTIQQFLDELVWREIHGKSSSDAFHNMINDLSVQARADTGVSLVKMLHGVALNPFKDWKISQYKPSPAPINETPANPPVTIPAPLKRPAPPPEDNSESNAKEMRPSSYYSTMYDKTKPPLVSSPQDAIVTCQHAGCQQILKTNIDMMLHMREHLVKDAAVAIGGEFNEHCIYCLETLPSAALRILHEENNHTFIVTFKGNKTRSEEVAIIKDNVCLICHEKFQHPHQLENHLDKTHVLCEMPYRCRVCHFKTSAHSQLIEHFYENHKTTSHLLCPLCLDTFDTKGDNQSKGQNTGHLQYLQHLRYHLSIPVNSRHRCKRCVLTFHEYDELRYHVRTDHNSSDGKAGARAFNFSILKPFKERENLLSSSAVIVTNNPSLVVATPTINVISAGPSSQFASRAGTRTSLKTYGKESTQDIPNTSVARRFSDIVLTQDAVEMGSICIECNEPLMKKNHFTGYFCCTLCRFSTCCTIGMKKHQNQVHRGQKGPLLGAVYQLSQLVKCECGFTSSSGIEVSQHMIRCGRTSISVAS